MKRPIAWVTGACGLIGSYILRVAPQYAPDWDVRPITRAQVDLLDFPAVRTIWNQQQPSLVIHCAAMSKSVDCQKNPDLARRVNVEATAQLAELAADGRFLFFSSDLVFDGRKGSYSERDSPNPLTVYGETKAAAEQIILRNKSHTVLRTSLNAGRSPAGDRSFTEETRSAWQKGKTLKLFTDEFRTPIPAIVTSRAVWEIVRTKATGLFHLGGAERLSRWEIGQLLAKRWPGVQAKMEPVSLRDYQGPPRSADTSLNCSRIQQLLSFPLPRFSEWLEENPAEPI